MINIVGVGSKVVEMFPIEEYTAEAFAKGMKEAGWEYTEDGEEMIHKATRTFSNGYVHEYIDKRVDVYSVFMEKEMHYSEYKTNYSGCRTKKDSYNSETKTIVVYVK